VSRSRTNPPRFIVLEGADGSGKSTQASFLAERLRARGRSVVETFEPGATALGARIRALVLDGPAGSGSAGGGDPDAVTEALLMAADRAQHVAEVVRPALVRGDWVVCDRFVPSSLVYQGVARGLGVDAVAAASAWATGGLEPDLIVVLDVDDAVADARRSQSDRLEREAETFHATVRAAYRDLARARGWAVVDANASATLVAEQVWSIVTEVVGE
jgi:dTMP kinase